MQPAPHPPWRRTFTFISEAVRQNISYCFRRNSVGDIDIRLHICMVDFNKASALTFLSGPIEFAELYVHTIRNIINLRQTRCSTNYLHMFDTLNACLGVFILRGLYVNMTFASQISLYQN